MYTASRIKENIAPGYPPIITNEVKRRSIDRNTIVGIIKNVLFFLIERKQLIIQQKYARIGNATRIIIHNIEAFSVESNKTGKNVKL